MPTRLILPTAIFIFLLSTTIVGVDAQTRRSTVGKLILNDPRPSGTWFDSTAFRDRQIAPTFHSAYRTIDGSKNNISSSLRTSWGAANIILFRELPAAYGPSDPRNAMGGVNRPSARKISNVLIDEPVTVFNTMELSTLVYQWGQFLDHELTLTPTGVTEYVPILLPPDEKIFTEEIPFDRSEFRPGVFQIRQQINLNTGWIDGSVVYGSDVQRAKWLRTFSQGKMKTSEGNLLPYNTVNGEYSGAIDPTAPSMKNDGGGTTKTFVAGDVRAAENPVLTSIHTIFVREHNRICDRLIAAGITNDEILYQSARKEVGAIIQAITYQEFLPALGVSLRDYSGYKNFVRPDIMNTFATAAYRLGHTMVSDDVVLADNNCEEVGPGEMELVDVFWNPQLIRDYTVDIFLKGSSSHDQYQVDTKINSVLRNFLFNSPNDPVRFGIDLGSLNIQRGRDHGLPDYNTARRFYTGIGARSFSDITVVDSVAQKLKSLYGSVNNIDLWIGVLAEDHLPGKAVGKTLHEMLKAQFEKLRDGDYYFYLGDPFLPANAKDRVRNTKFSDLIKRNTSLTNILANAFHTNECPEDAPAAAQSKSAGAVPNAVLPNAVYKIYPNPVKDILNIELADSDQSSTIGISSTDGIVLKSIVAGAHQQRVQVNISSFSSGMYVVNISNGKQSRIFKFIKQ
jgi:peroxidase